MPHFPTIRASNLAGKDFTLPEDFEGQWNLLFVAFERHQQEDVDTWTPHARQLCEADSSVRFYELPTIRRGNPTMRWMAERDGNIRWRSIGTWSADKEESPRRVLTEEGGGAS